MDKMSICMELATRRKLRLLSMHTNVEKNCAVALFVDDVVLEDLVIESSRFGVGGRHFELSKQVFL